MHPALGAQSLNHWTTREVPCIFFRLVYLEALSDPVFLQQDCIYVGVSGGACHQRQDIWFSSFLLSSFQNSILQKKFFTNMCSWIFKHILYFFVFTLFLHWCLTFWFLLFIYHCCAGSSIAVHGLSLVVTNGGCSPVAVRRLLSVVASLIMEHGLQVHGLQ